MTEQKKCETHLEVVKATGTGRNLQIHGVVVIQHHLHVG